MARWRPARQAGRAHASVPSLGAAYLHCRTPAEIAYDSLKDGSACVKPADGPFGVEKKIDEIIALFETLEEPQPDPIVADLVDWANQHLVAENAGRTHAPEPVPLPLVGHWLAGGALLSIRALCVMLE